MELTDAQILEQLRMRRVKLKIELERVEAAIKAFEKVNIFEIEPLDAAPYLIDDITTSDEALAMATLLYNPKDSFEKKVIFVLSKIGEGDVKDITQYLLRIDKDIKDTVAIYNRITYVASRLFKTGRIMAIKTGKKNIYKLM